jgi:hypothetical protein
VIVAERLPTHVVQIEAGWAAGPDHSRYASEEHGTRMTIEHDARWRSPLHGCVLESRSSILAPPGVSKLEGDRGARTSGARR